MIGREGVGARGLVLIVVPGIVPAAERLTRLGGARHLVLFRQQLSFRRRHTLNVDPPRDRASRVAGVCFYLGPPDTGSAPRRPGGPALA
jgi:hypothetical protein